MNDMNIKIIITVKCFGTDSWTCSRLNTLSDDNFYVSFLMLFCHHHHHHHHRRRRRHHHRHPYRDYRSKLRKNMFFAIVAS